MKFKSLALAALAAFSLSSCSDWIYEDEGDCTVKYYLQFVYDMNLKWADAFPSEVHSVNVYAFDADGVFVKEFASTDPAIDEAGYKMRLDLAPGDYQLVGWCGLDNGVEEESFTVTRLVAGESTLDDFICSLNTTTDSEGNVISDKRIYFLYHGNISVNLPDAQDGKDYLYTMPLTKDTNHIRIMVQQATTDIEASELNIQMRCDNGVMAYNNSLLGDTYIDYLPWNQESDILGYAPEDADDTKAADLLYYKGVVADLSTCRMMADKNLYLNISRADNDEEIVFNVPVIQYALMMKPYYVMAYGHQMSDQEFLDRQDEYVMTFFLDEGMRWLYTIIEVLDWRLVIHNYELS